MSSGLEAYRIAAWRDELAAVLPLRPQRVGHAKHSPEFVGRGGYVSSVRINRRLCCRGANGRTACVAS